LARLLQNDLPRLAERQLIAFLQLPVVRVELLHCIVCEVDKGLVYLLKAELVRACSDVSFREEVAALISEIDHVYKDPESDVELPAVYQQRLLNVLLNYENFRFHIRS